MANKNPLNQFKKGDKRASEAGKKSKRKPFDQKMREWLDSAVKEGENLTVHELFQKALMKEGAKGNVQAIKEVYDRAYGKAKQNIKLSGDVKTGDDIQTLESIDNRLLEIRKKLGK